jgi:hypothetical protein
VLIAPLNEDVLEPKVFIHIYGYRLAIEHRLVLNISLLLTVPVMASTVHKRLLLTVWSIISSLVAFFVEKIG